MNYDNRSNNSNFSNVISFFRLGHISRGYDRKMETLKYLVIERDNYKSLHAATSIGQRELILHLKGVWTPYPTKTSIQVGERHLESETGACINHSCSPNAEIIYIQGWDANGSPVSSGTTGLVSLEKIQKGKEITFNYNLTESILANPFKCNCCGKEIKGKDYEL
tara:strand:+ start:566 stop:1060 length:495 start_codon:yes stop_codon:yes gene_type:complete